MKTELTMTTPLPSAHEPLPADFLRKYGAQKGMRYRQKGNAEDAWDLWPDWGDKFPAETCYNLYDFCAPIGTIAAATTPLPEGRCDCGYTPFLSSGGHASKHHADCSTNIRYRHILPAALAALYKEPKELLCAWAGNANWKTPDEFFSFAADYDWKKFCKVILETPGVAYAIAAQSGQGKGKEYRVTCPHCLGQQKANGAVCLECNGIGYWMNPYPLSTQPEGGEECAPQQMPATSVAVGHMAEEQVSARSTPSPSSASNAAPANVPTVAGSGQGELDVDAAVQNILGQFMTDQIADSAKDLKPPPPSTAGETGRTDAAERARARALPLITDGTNQVCVSSTTLIQAFYSHEIAATRDLERQLAEATAENDLLEQEILTLRTQLAAVTAWKDEISAAIQRSGLGIMRTSQGPAGTMICTRPEVKDAEDKKVLELINENIDLESRLTAVTAERDEARKRLETIQTT